MAVDRIPAHLSDMLDFVEEIQSLLAPHDVDSFVKERVLCLAIEKLFINLGEAAVRMGEGAQRFPNIPWRQIIGLRNILAHGYEQVAHEILFQTAVQEFPGLREQLRSALSQQP